MPDHGERGRRQALLDGDPLRSPPRPRAAARPAAAGPGARTVCRGLVLLIAAIPPAVAAPLGAQDAGPVPVEAGSVLVGGDSIRYEVAGVGRAILLLHDGLTHGGVWDETFASLARDHRVVRFDRRGHGRSDAPAAPYSPVDDVEAVLDAAGVRRATLVGASSGGGLALAYALERPGRVERLVLVGAVVPGYGYSEHFTARGFRNSAPLLDGKPKRALDAWVDDPWIVAPGNGRARKRFRALLEPFFEKHMDQRPDLVELPEPSVFARLPRIEVPALILVGEADIPDVHAHAGVLETGLPDARRVVVEDAGHLLHLERPSEFERLVRSFLEEG